MTSCKWSFQLQTMNKVASGTVNLSQVVSWTANFYRASALFYFFQLVTVCDRVGSTLSTIEVHMLHWIYKSTRVQDFVIGCMEGFYEKAVHDADKEVLSAYMERGDVSVLPIVTGKRVLL